jgi:pilus assembly protein CpaF
MHSDGFGDLQLEGLADRIHDQLTQELEADLTEGILERVPQKEELERRLLHLIKRQPEILSQRQISVLSHLIINRVVGIGPLQPLLEDPTISEIMVNHSKSVFIEREGKIEATPISFRDDAHLLHIIDRIVAPIGRRIDESSPMVDARLSDGSRVNAVIPPLAIDGPILTIRKFSKEPFTLSRLVRLGTLSSDMATLLENSIHQKKSIVVSGGTGTGKTSTLNALGRIIPPNERLITIEDSAELNLGHPHLVSVEARPPNIEGEGEVTIRTLVRNALRMRPDRIIVGEVRGGEAFDMLQAMNTGHQGSLTTLHANSVSDALIRLESMVLMAGFDLPLDAIRRMISGGIQLILQMDRGSDGRRVVTNIQKLVGMQDQELILEPLMVFDPTLDAHRAAPDNKRSDASA